MSGRNWEKEQRFLKNSKTFWQRSFFFWYHGREIEILRYEHTNHACFGLLNQRCDRYFPARCEWHNRVVQLQLTSRDQKLHPVITARSKTHTLLSVRCIWLPSSFISLESKLELISETYPFGQPLPSNLNQETNSRLCVFIPINDPIAHHEQHHITIMVWSLTSSSPTDFLAKSKCTNTRTRVVRR